MLSRFHQSTGDGSSKDVRVLRQTTLPIVAAPVVVVGWAWLVYVLVHMGGDVFIAPTIAPAALLICSGLALQLNDRHTMIATLTLVLGLTIAVFAESWLSFAGMRPYAFVLLVAIIGLMLRPTSGLISAVIYTLLIAIAGRFGASGALPWPDIMPPVVLVCLTAGVSFLAARNLYHALDWAWQNSLLAGQRLEEARDHQEALNRTLRSLDDMYVLLARARREEAIARQQAEEGQRQKSQFASTVSHELRTPLNAIIGFSELMHMAPEIYGHFAWPPALRSDANEIYRNALHLQRLIDDILDLAQIDAMRMQLMEEETDLAVLIHDTVAAASGLVRSRNVCLDTAIGDNLPRIYVDTTRIRQVLLNLLSNACRFTEHGRIVITACVENDDIHVSVADTGIGMTPQQVSRTFREFQQADSSLRRRYGGTGLGLAISKRFVQLHGGRIWVDSELGVGTTVHFTLPIARAPYMQGAYETEGMATLPIEEMETKTVILQGGLSSGLRLLGRYVGGYHFLPSSNSAHTLQLVDSNHPWAVIVASEGAADAEDVADMIHAANAAIAVPVLSYAINPSEMVQMPASVEWFTKPVKRTDLLAALQRVAPGGTRVLVVDDNPTDAQLLSRMLYSAEQEYEVQEAYSGSEALQIAAATPPDAMLLDLIMPDMSGLEVLNRLRGNPALACLPVIMVSAGDAAAQQGPLQAPNVHRLTVVKSGGLKTQEWLASIKALLDVVAPRYVAGEDTPESYPPGRRG
jgi:signal transduction histidine kinase/CheY-like chemotaxis protein